MVTIRITYTILATLNRKAPKGNKKTTNPSDPSDA